MAGWPPEPGETGTHADGSPFVFPRDIAEWRGWLERSHAGERQVWLILPKPGSGLAGISLAEAADEALCWGWIDSRPSALDDSRRALRMSPRPPRSAWSEPARKRVAALQAAGRMTPAGLAVVEAARRDGSWTGIAAAEALNLPVDLLRPLSADPAAAAGWAAFPKDTRAMLQNWVQDSPRQSVRAERVKRVVAGAKAGRSPLPGA